VIAGSKDKSKPSPPTSPIHSAQTEETSAATNRALRKSSTHEKLLSQLFEEEGDILSSNEVVSCSSRLSLSLAEVIADKGALGYFIQFMEARDVGALIRFWLDVECFRLAAVAEQSQASRAKALLSKRGVNSSPSETSCISDHDSAFESQYSEPTHVKSSEKRSKDKGIGDSTVGSEKSTPEHKSEYSATRECSAKKEEWTGRVDQDIDARYDSEGLDRQSVNSTSIWNDAIRIYDKYLAPNAMNAVSIPDEYKNSAATVISSDSDVNPDCFLPAQRACFEIMENE